MPDVSDMELLQDYARNGSETAFAELVRRHVGLVYSAALRQVGIAAHAEEISQVVFVILAQKAARLRPDTILEGWLYQTARLTALSFLRGERRRQWREQEACMQSALQESGEPVVWNQFAPLLDQAMARLGKTDREAVVLRYFKGKSLHEVAAALKITEAAAQSRVHRSVGKLQKFFLRHGIDSTTAAIAGAISANSVMAAPAGLAKTISVVAVAKGAAAGTSTLPLVKGALKLMAWTKAKTAIVAGAAILLAAATATVTIKEVQIHKNDEWQLGELDAKFLTKPPYRTVILPTKSAQRSRKNGTGGNVSMRDGRGYGINASIEDMLRYAFPSAQGELSPARTILDFRATTNRFDYFSNLPTGARQSLTKAIERKFGVICKFETIETNALVLSVAYPDKPGLKRSFEKYGVSNTGNGQMSFTRETMSDLAGSLELYLGIPVIDKTELTNHYDFKINWGDTGRSVRHFNRFKQALLHQLGLELVPTNLPIEMLVVARKKS